MTDPADMQSQPTKPYTKTIHSSLRPLQGRKVSQFVSTQIIRTPDTCRLSENNQQTNIALYWCIQHDRQTGRERVSSHTVHTIEVGRRSAAGTSPNPKIIRLWYRCKQTLSQNAALANNAEHGHHQSQAHGTGNTDFLVNYISFRLQYTSNTKPLSPPQKPRRGCHQCRRSANAYEQTTQSHARRASTTHAPRWHHFTFRGWHVTNNATRQHQRAWHRRPSRSCHTSTIETHTHTHIVLVATRFGSMLLFAQHFFVVRLISSIVLTDCTPRYAVQNFIIFSLNTLEKKAVFPYMCHDLRK